MPKIRLKQNSPEFADGKTQTSKPKMRCCEMPSCKLAGEYRAPRDRSLSGYYWFCYEHVQEYNKAWNYFSGMSDQDMQDYINKATIWDRPTRRYDSAATAESIRNAAWKFYHFTDKDPPKDKTTFTGAQKNTPEIDALTIMGLMPPITLAEIKKRYKELAKRYHPDTNRDEPDAEEMLKKINMAYTVLKLAYQKFETLPER
jgi:hypothetical protein